MLFCNRFQKIVTFNYDWLDSIDLGYIWNL
jgi:hypothetical protein